MTLVPCALPRPEEAAPPRPGVTSPRPPPHSPRAWGPAGSSAPDSSADARAGGAVRGRRREPGHGRLRRLSRRRARRHPGPRAGPVADPSSLLVLTGALAAKPATHATRVGIALRLPAGVASAPIFVIAAGSFLSHLREHPARASHTTVRWYAKRPVQRPSSTAPAPAPVATPGGRRRRCRRRRPSRPPVSVSPLDRRPARPRTGEGPGVPGERHFVESFRRTQAGTSRNHPKSAQPLGYADRGLQPR